MQDFFEGSNDKDGNLTLIEKDDSDYAGGTVRSLTRQNGKKNPPGTTDFLI